MNLPRNRCSKSVRRHCPDPPIQHGAVRRKPASGKDIDPMRFEKCCKSDQTSNHARTIEIATRRRIDRLAPRRELHLIKHYTSLDLGADK
jgi:hypothetical protein